MSDEIKDFDELRESRSNFLLGRGQPKRPTESQQYDAALEKMRDADPYDDVHDYIQPEENPERTTYRNERHAFETFSEDAKWEAEVEADAAQRREREAAEQERREARAAGQLNQQELAELQVLQDRVQQYEDAVQQYQSWAQQDGVTAEQRQQYEQILQQEKQDIEQGRQQAARYIQHKQLAGGRAQLPKELRNKEIKEKFIKRLEREGIPRDRIEGETDPMAIGRLFRQFQHEERIQEARQKQRKVAEWGEKNFSRRPGLDQPRSTEEAHQRLKQSGTMEDAARLLSMRKVERML